MRKTIKGSAGQVALLVLVISAIVMTLGLSVAKKSTVETKITTDEELLKQAFNAAESGVEYYLETGTTKYVVTGGGTGQADITVSNIGGGNVVNLNRLTLDKNLSFTWLVGHKADGSINDAEKYNGTSLAVCVDSGFKGALKVDYFYKDGSGYGVKRFGFGINSSVVLDYESPSFVGSCTGIDNTQKIDITSKVVLWPAATPLLLVVTPIGGNTRVAVEGNSTFPVQAQEINSLGSVGDVQTGVKRNVKVVNQYQVPAFMLEAITATGSVE